LEAPESHPGQPTALGHKSPQLVCDTAAPNASSGDYLMNSSHQQLYNARFAPPRTPSPFDSTGRSIYPFFHSRVSGRLYTPPTIVPTLFFYFYRSPHLRPVNVSIRRPSSFSLHRSPPTGKWIPFHHPASDICSSTPISTAGLTNLRHLRCTILLPHHDARRFADHLLRDPTNARIHAGEPLPKIRSIAVRLLAPFRLSGSIPTTTTPFGLRPRRQQRTMSRDIPPAIPPTTAISSPPGGRLPRRHLTSALFLFLHICPSSPTPTASTTAQETPGARAMAAQRLPKDAPYVRRENVFGPAPRRPVPWSRAWPASRNCGRRGGLPHGVTCAQGSPSSTRTHSANQCKLPKERRSRMVGKTDWVGSALASRRAPG